MKHFKNDVATLTRIYISDCSNVAITVALTLCTAMSSVTRHKFLSQQLLCRVPLDILSCALLFVKCAKEKQACILEIVSKYIIHLKITKYNNSMNKTGISVNFLLPLFI